MTRTTAPSRLAPELVDLGLEEYVLALEIDGLAVVPPEVHGVDDDEIVHLRDLVIVEAGRLVGTTFDLDLGPADELEFPESKMKTRVGDGEEASQFLVPRLARVDRAFRDLAINPVVIALIRHLVGRRATRFSSQNSFVKWQGPHGYGPSLGMHADQSATPQPWGTRSRTANTNWCLTDYTLEGGAFAYVPGSHRAGTPPRFPDAVDDAVPVIAPRGSMIIFHGGLWHGAFPRQIPGMRLSVANYYRHLMITSQDDFRNSFPRDLIDDCADPELFRLLVGVDDDFPYAETPDRIPRALTPDRQP